MTFPDLPTVGQVAGMFAGSGLLVAVAIGVLAAALLCAVFLLIRAKPAKPAAVVAETTTPVKSKGRLEDRLTLLVAIIIAGFCAQGMGKFLHDKLHFPIELVIGVGGVLELTAFTCALRARRNVLDPKVGKAGIDGVAVWAVAGLSGAFAAMDETAFEVALFRLVMPLLAAWLWERGMSIERRRVQGGSTIHWRVTPERLLVWLRVAEPSGRTASEVDAHRRLTRVAKAAARVRSLRNGNGWAPAWLVSLAEHRLGRAMRSAVAHAGLAADPQRQRALIDQIGSLYNAGTLADLTPDAPWAEFTTPVHRSWFEVQGVRFTPIEFTPRPVQVHAEVQRLVHEPEPASEPPHREPEPAADVNHVVHEPAKPVVQEPRPNQRTVNHRVVRRAANLPDRAARKADEVQDVVNLIGELGYDEVTLSVVRERLGFAKTTAYKRLTEARDVVNQRAAS